MDFKMNFNEIVKVKLTPRGEQILRKRHDDLDLVLKSNGGKGLNPFKLEKDEDGYSKFQFWDLMNTFGPYVSLGLEAPFDSEIIMTKGEPLWTIEHNNISLRR